MENQKRICVAICFGSSNHFTGLYVSVRTKQIGTFGGHIPDSTYTLALHWPIGRRTIGPWL